MKASFILYPAIREIAQHCTKSDLPKKVPTESLMEGPHNLALDRSVYVNWTYQFSCLLARLPATRFDCTVPAPMCL